MAPCENLQITADEVADELRGAVDTNDLGVVAWLERQIEKAEGILYDLCPATETKIKQGDTRAIRTAKRLIIDAVARVARVEPDAVGLKSESEDGYSYTVDPLTRSSNIWYPDSELAQLGCGVKAAPFTPRSATLARGTAWHGVIR